MELRKFLTFSGRKHDFNNIKNAHIIVNPLRQIRIYLEHDTLQYLLKHIG